MSIQKLHTKDAQTPVPPKAPVEARVLSPLVRMLAGRDSSARSKAMANQFAASPAGPEAVVEGDEVSGGIDVDRADVDVDD